MSKLQINSVLTSGGMQMPIVGLGTWQCMENETESTLAVAIEAGYRHIDTSFLYMNEAAIGRTLKKMFENGTLTREEIFIVTKLPPLGMRPGKVEPYLKKQLENLQLDYVDLYLVHYPMGIKEVPGQLFPRNEKGELDIDVETDLLAIWKDMEDQFDAGRAKAIGVSNYNLEQVKRILDNCRIPPANNQVELHVYFQQKELVSFCKENNVTITAYGPLGSPNLFGFTQMMGASTEGLKDYAPLSDPVIIEIANNHGKKPSQILLRYLIEYGIAVIPKSTNPERIRLNIDLQCQYFGVLSVFLLHDNQDMAKEFVSGPSSVRGTLFDFELTSEEFQQILDLDKGEEGRLFFATGFLAGFEKHPEYPYSK